jgi:hypothetical protein
MNTWKKMWSGGFELEWKAAGQTINSQVEPPGWGSKLWTWNVSNETETIFLKGTAADSGAAKLAAIRMAAKLDIAPPWPKERREKK